MQNNDIITLPSGRQLRLSISDTVEFANRPCMRLDDLNQWCEALTSGRYKQDKMQLKTPIGNCCLGVLCEIHNVEWVEQSGYLFEDNQLGNEELSINFFGELTRTGVFKGFSLIAYEQQLSNSIYISLAALNDGGYGFVDIAQVIRLFWTPDSN